MKRTAQNTFTAQCAARTGLERHQTGTNLAHIRPQLHNLSSDRDIILINQNKDNSTKTLSNVCMIRENETHGRALCIFRMVF